MVAAGDDVIVTKSGKETHGLGRFFSSIDSKAVPGLGFLSLSLISVKHRVSYPVVMEPLQSAHPCQGKQEVKHKRPSNSKRGRRKDSKNVNRRDVELSPYLKFVQHHLKHLLDLTKDHLQIRHFVFDGVFGNNDALQMVRQTGLHLVSKLRHDSALYFAYTGRYAGRGPHKKYGAKLNDDEVPEKHLKISSRDKDIETKTYQMQMRHKKFADLLNVVVIVKRNLKTKKVSHIVLFSSDLELSYELMIDSYRLRFQLEFNFRDAKQHWGLEDFMVVSETPIYNSANVAMVMVNVSQALRRPMRSQWPEVSVNDLKTWFRSRKYVVET